MDTRKNMILLKGEIKTADIESCEYNGFTEKVDVKFNNGKIYSYNRSNVEKLKAPKSMATDMYRISIRSTGKSLYNLKEIYVFKGRDASYWHIIFQNGRECDYNENELNISKSCLDNENTKNVFNYIRQIAELNDLKNDISGEKLLAKNFNKINFVGDDVVLSKYLEPRKIKNDNVRKSYIPVFPFGCNNSQYNAVKNAMENQISVIQGPPGTGKTQTILNIISNILIDGKSVQIVSNNNAAIENIYDKLSSSEINLNFILAKLGNRENKECFIATQNGKYPSFVSEKYDVDKVHLKNDISIKSVELKEIFDKQEEIAKLKQERSQLETEFEYFKGYISDIKSNISTVRYNEKVSSKRVMKLLTEFQMLFEEKKRPGILFKIKMFLICRIYERSFYRQNEDFIFAALKNMYYRTRLSEIINDINEIESYINRIDGDPVEEICNKSMTLLRSILAEKYSLRKERHIFDRDDLWKDPEHVLDEYPVILSTTFSSRNSLNNDTVYDYLIIDEASQVDIATGALAMSCARNIVIVGDVKQLSHVVNGETAENADKLFDRFNVNEGYRYEKSFLRSVLEIMPDVAQTVLAEHYRCHPKIINFCNQKFYKNQLIIMTEDKGEDDVLKVIKTVPGNHERDRYSQRQIDVIKTEIIDKYDLDMEKTGIITPYKNQKNALNDQIKDSDSSTVHKFQGREKDNIIISTVDDLISDFADDPNLINVAVSRAKRRLILVVTGNQQNKERNIIDLMNYIKYNNFEVIDSKIYSIFDYLYKQYDKERKVYLQRKKRISEYDSENLMYALIEDILSDEKYVSLDVVCHFPLSMLIRDNSLLSAREASYIQNPATHVDFLIYSRLSKMPVLAIEVDGYSYHLKESKQHERDMLKNHVMKLYGIELLRLRTNESGENEKIKERLDKLFN